MFVYALKEDPWDSDVFIGVFSSPDKAKLMAERREGFELYWDVHQSVQASTGLCVKCYRKKLPHRFGTFHRPVKSDTNNQEA